MGKTISALLLMGDALIILCSVPVIFTFRFYSQLLPVTKGIPPLRPYLGLIPFLLVINLMVFSVYGLYQTRGRKTRPEELIKIFISVTFSQIILIALLQFYREFSYSRFFLVAHYLFLFAAVIIWRFSFRAYLQHLHRRGKFLQRILIVGAGKIGRSLVDRINAHAELGFVVIGFLDDDPGKNRYAYKDVRVLGSTTDCTDLVRDLKVDSVYITIPLQARQKIFTLVRSLEDLYVEIRLIPDVIQLMALRSAVEDLDGLPVVHLNFVPMEGWPGLIKRIMDILVSFLALIILSPLFGIIAFLIKREDGGPVFFRQTRMGLDGKSFNMWKFRSMQVDAEKNTGPVFTSKLDPRRTRIGSFIRKISLDELPQLINVLMGDMSLVGPRPERPEFVDTFKKKFPGYMVRHRVKCGITGWAQVNGYRGNTSIKKRLEYDLYYIQNWSVGLDMKIIWRTLRVGLFKNAY